MIETTEIYECPVCSFLPSAKNFRAKDRWLGVPGSWEYVRCSNPECDCIWLLQRPTPEFVGRLYENYFTHETPKSRSRLFECLYPNPFEARKRLARNENLLPPDLDIGSVLEIGCGNGSNLNTLQRKGWRVTGHEIDTSAAARASELLGVDVLVGDFHKLDLEGETFDVVLARHVIEHCPNPREVLAKAFSVLRPGGSVILMTPNSLSAGFKLLGAKWRGLEPPRHFLIAGPASVEQLVIDAGFVDVRVTTSSVAGGGVFAQSIVTRRKVISAVIGFCAQIFEDISRIFNSSCGWELIVRASKPREVPCPDLGKQV